MDTHRLRPSAQALALGRCLKPSQGSGCFHERLRSVLRTGICWHIASPADPVPPSNTSTALASLVHLTQLFEPPGADPMPGGVAGEQLTLPLCQLLYTSYLTNAVPDLSTSAQYK